MRDGEPSAVGRELLALLGRALGVERSALLVEEAPGRNLVPVAMQGRVRVSPVPPGGMPEGGPWSLAIPIRTGERTTGLLLLARAEGVPFSAADRALAEGLASMAARVVEQEHTAAELERTRELLSRADRLSALGTLSAAVAHEIRNPLVSVRTFIQLLPERLHDEEFRTGFRDLALGEIERICGLINDLLAFSRPAPAEREPTDLNELVGQIARLLDAEARRQDVVIASRTDPALPTVVVDDAQVKQVLMNVVLNAIQAAGPHGRVEISTRIVADERGRWSAVDVADSGPGIAPEHLGSIFDPFFTTKDAGSGLGLFIARQIVAAHGGRLMPGLREGGGTVFSIHFPVPAAPGRSDAPEA